MDDCTSSLCESSGRSISIAASSCNSPWCWNQIVVDPYPPTFTLTIQLIYPLFLSLLSFLAFFDSRWFACQYSPIVLKPFPTLRSVEGDKFWSVLHPRSLSSSFDACNSTVSSLYSNWLWKRHDGRTLWARSSLSRELQLLQGPDILSVSLKIMSGIAFSHSRNDCISPVVCYAVGLCYRIHWGIRNCWWSQVVKDCHWIDWTFEQVWCY